MKRLYPLFLVWFICTSCKKDTADKIPFKKIETGIQGKLHVLCALNATTLIAGGEHHGEGAVILSTTSGNSWKILPARTEGAITALLAIDSVTWYAGTASPHAYKTMDGGITWEKLWVNTDYPPNYRKPVRRIVKTNDTTVYFAIGGDFEAGGIWKTYDGGTTWKAHTFNFELRDVVFKNDDIGYACGYGNMIQTLDGGETWTYSPCSNAYFMKLHFDNSNNWWSVSFNGGVYSSNDPASGWNEILNAAKVFSGRKNFNGFYRDDNKSVLFGEKGLLVTGSSSGNNWHEVSCCNENSIRDLTVSGNHYAACSRSGEIYLIDRN
ncbi:MAG: hypothetical protein JNL47_01730 [Bacteroidia bacterium]|nr:hypothetical protein [Bacteroidia bacterium]